MRIGTNYDIANIIGSYPLGNQVGQSFSEIIGKKIDGATDTYEKTSNNTFEPTCSEDVMQAYEKTLTDTGIEPFPMNRISTALVIQVEQGTGQLNSNFMGDSAESAKTMIKKILERINNPLSPPAHPDFVEKERIFYEKFLENLENI